MTKEASAARIREWKHEMEFLAKQLSDMYCLTEKIEDRIVMLEQNIYDEKRYRGATNDKRI